MLQIVEDDLIFRADVATKFIHGENCRQGGRCFLRLFKFCEVTHDRRWRYVMPACNVGCRDKLAVFFDDGLNDALRHSLIAIDERIFFGEGFPAVAAPITASMVDVEQLCIGDAFQCLIAIFIDAGVLRSARRASVDFFRQRETAAVLFKKFLAFVWKFLNECVKI